MNKKEIIVPGNIRYITEWKDFIREIDQFPCIIDKQLTGCGFTEWCLTNDLNIILCSPRRILLENKESQHQNDVLYAKNEYEKITGYDKFLSSKGSVGKEEEAIENLEAIEHFKRQVKSWAMHKLLSNPQKPEPCKILVTYDSFRYVKSALLEEGILDRFLVVIDEWQSIFTDSKFKSTTEMDLLNQLRDLNSVMYVSATPMIDKYLEQMPEFHDLPHYTLNWAKESAGRVIHPDLNVKKVYNNTSITSIACDIIERYRQGDFDKAAVKSLSGDLQTIESREAVFYVNSVKNICDILKKSGMKPEECNILCAETKDNVRKIKSSLQITKINKDFRIGKVPGRGELHKMFTFCTRTVYLGADFYSTNAKSYIFSDANVDSLSVDITLDLPQILGRQRLDCNPWKNSATLYYKVINAKKEETIEEFRKRIDEKIDLTESLLRTYENALDVDKNGLAKTYQDVAKAYNYKNNYVAVNTRGGKILIPCLNTLVRLADERTYEIQQIDFKDRFSVFKGTSEIASVSVDILEVDNFLERFNNSFTTFIDKMKFVCTTKFSSQDNENCVLNQIPVEYKNYINLLGKDKIIALGCQKSKLNGELGKTELPDISEEIYKNFSVGYKATKAEIKEKLRSLYNSLDYKASPKASDLEKYFELKTCLIVNKTTGKKDNGFELISKK